VDVRSLNDEQASEQGMARWGGPLALLVSVLGILVVGATTARLVPGDVWFAHPGDHHIYRWMAENGPIDFHVAPWGWRPTVPWLALALPIGIKAGFQLVTSVCLIVTASLMYVVGRGFGFQRAEALAGVVLFLGLGYAVRFNLYDFWLPDATAFLFVALAVVLIQRRADPSLALCLAVGVAAKESVLLVVGLCYGLRADRPFDVQTAKRAALVALPALAVLAAIRLGIDPHNGDPGYLRSFPDVIWLNAKRLPSYSFSPVLSETLSARVTALAPTVTKALSAFGLLIGGLAVVGAATRRQLALRFAPFLALVFAQLLFAGDTQRLVVLAFPAVIVLALAGGVSLCRWAGVSTVWLLLAALAFLALSIASGDHEWQPQPLVQATLVAIALVALWSGRHWRRSSQLPRQPDSPASQFVL
jgi:hypothetical protein